MPTGQGKVEKCCAHYRQRLSECANCEYSDAMYKECFLKKKDFVQNRNGMALFKAYLKED